MTAALDTLPPEILFKILSFTSPFNPYFGPNRPLYSLAATNRHLHDVVEEYARGLLKKHANIESPNPPTRAFVRRVKWMKWLSTTCWICHRTSRRKAILDPSMTCCDKCDRKTFPKMTMTEAITKHGLSKLDLFTPCILHPNLPPLNTGVYMCMGGYTIMISESDVFARKAYVDSLMGSKAQDMALRRRRVARHDRIAKHMDIEYRNGGWRKAWNFPAHSDANLKTKSLQTQESRDKYVREGLRKEWAEMGINKFAVVDGRGHGEKSKGVSAEEPIELD
ncbi:hypothetical protein CC78DRAFT_616656 [Lojkania enalia]|uniref:F-box domain-containing protein n=1 Tax=Lojkania enalia TaxID=147567 RepID=A0A9P4N8E9_9PLEO|nr:hypothetical protein CC78DRAFT_616656 [Didymosphaeria enalia]